MIPINLPYLRTSDTVNNLALKVIPIKKIPPITAWIIGSSIKKPVSYTHLDVYKRQLQPWYPLRTSDK